LLKKLRRFQLVKAAQPLIPKTAEAIQGIIWRQRMYTQVVADLYPGQVAGGQP
jgi:flagellar biosynthesis regulator FlaF